MLRLQELFIAFTSMMKEYSWLGFAVSAWGLTIVTLVFRRVPAAVFGFLKRQLSTTLVFDSSYTTGDRNTCVRKASAKQSAANPGSRCHAPHTTLHEAQ